MNSDQIFDAIEAVAAQSSKKEKERLIASFGKHEGFLRVLQAALDPFVTYGIAKIPNREPNTEGERFDESTWRMLGHLAKRELTGNEARDSVKAELDSLTDESAELLSRILRKDLRAGFSESTVNKAIPGLIPTFACMLAHPFNDYRHRVTYPVYCEPKYDGVRVLAIVRTAAGSVKFFSRSGQEFTTFEHLKQPLLEVARGGRVPATDFVFDGEVVSGSFLQTVSQVRRKEDQATDAFFYAFDVLTLDEFSAPGKGGVGQPYVERRKLLEWMLPPVPPGERGVIRCMFRFHAVDEAGVHGLYESMRDQGLEGLMVKDPRGLYHRRRNHAWLKIKAEESADMPIVGAFEGEGKYAGMLGGLIGDFNGVKVNVGGGFTDEQRREFWAAWKSPDSGDGTILLERVMEVLYHEVTPDGSLRHPRFKRFRDDKPLVKAA